MAGDSLEAVQLRINEARRRTKIARLGNPINEDLSQLSGVTPRDRIEAKLLAIRVVGQLAVDMIEAIED